MDSVDETSINFNKINNAFDYINNMSSGDDGAENTTQGGEFKQSKVPVQEQEPKEQKFLDLLEKLM